jgi:lipopolysaccharide export system permease protein
MTLFRKTLYFPIYLYKELIPFRLIDKYIFSEFFKTFLGTLILLTGIMIISQVMDNLRNFINSKQPPYHIVLFLVFNSPKMIVAVIPPALMFSVCFVVGQFNVNKELVSIMAAGTSFYRATMTIFLTGFIMSIMVFFLGEFIVRPANTLANEELSIIMKGIGTKKDLVYQLNTKGKEGFYYIYWYDNEKRMIRGGFNYIKISSQNFPELILSAQNATYSDATNLWTLEKVEEIKLDSNLMITSFNIYPESTYQLPEKPEYFRKAPKSIDQMNFLELSDEIVERKAKAKGYYDLEVERQTIFAIPIMSMIVVIIGAISGTFTKKSAGIASLGITIGIVLVYYILFSIGKSLGENGGIHPAIGVWSTPTLFIGISIYLVKKFNL